MGLLGIQSHYCQNNQNNKLAKLLLVTSILKFFVYIKYLAININTLIVVFYIHLLVVGIAYYLLYSKQSNTTKLIHYYK